METTRTSSIQQRSVVLVTPDVELRHRLADQLRSCRWQVYTAAGGAEAMLHLASVTPELMVIDHWLPDLEVAEFARYAGSMCPGTDLLGLNGNLEHAGVKSARRSELLHALREAQDRTTSTPEPMPLREVSVPVAVRRCVSDGNCSAPPAAAESVRMHLPGIVGDSASMKALAAEINLVAAYDASVLVLGETGTGKELIAQAVHTLSPRASRPFVVLNCAAIPEQLLEAELFGHTRGAFTGAVTSRVGRMEAAHGGTLFLDEIGEMPLPLQAKMLRFLENGEIQKVGENDSIRVDVRIVAATHQPLEQRAAEGHFRMDLYHRLAVFPVDVPPLRDRRDDIPMLVEHLLEQLGRTMPRKTISVQALDRLLTLSWPGNVRELSHVLQRAAILSGDASVIQPEHLRVRSTDRAANTSSSVH